MRKHLSGLVIVPTLIFGICQADWAQSATLPGPDAVTIKTPAGAVVDGLALSATTDKQAYMGGNAIVLKIALINSTDAYQYRMVVGSASPLDLFDFDVTYADEGLIPLTAFGAKRLKRRLGAYFDPFSVFGLGVPPGKSLVYQVVISRLFDMSRGGTYQMTARWHDPSAGRADQHNPKRLSTFVSNQAIVRVEEPPSEFYGGSGFGHH